MECSSCEFPLHCMESHIGTCKRLLMKLVKIGKKEVLKPIKTCCYKLLINSLTELLSKPDIAEACCEWKIAIQQIICTLMFMMEISGRSLKIMDFFHPLIRMG